MDTKLVFSKPYVGDFYSQNKTKILVVGESHYKDDWCYKDYSDKYSYKE